MLPHGPFRIGFCRLRCMCLGMSLGAGRGVFLCVVLLLVRLVFGLSFFPSWCFLCWVLYLSFWFCRVLGRSFV